MCMKAFATSVLVIRAIEDEQHLLYGCSLYNNLHHYVYNYVSQHCTDFINLNHDDKVGYMLK